VGFRAEEIQPFGKGYALPRRFTETIDARNLPYIVEIEVEFEDDRLVPISVSARRKPRGQPISSDGLRRLPVKGLVRQMALMNLMKVDETSPATYRISPDALRGLEGIATGGPTDEALEYVALVYRIAFAANDNPVQAVMDIFQLPRSTASRWVGQARERGFLGPAQERRPGEKRQPRRRKGVS
jgi:hypothetical protein